VPVSRKRSRAIVRSCLRFMGTMDQSFSPL
jgi:hypothetical protein